MFTAIFSLFKITTVLQKLSKHLMLIGEYRRFYNTPGSAPSVCLYLYLFQCLFV